MNLEDLQARLNSIEMTLQSQEDLIKQKMADLNVLIGQKNECLHWIGMMKSSQEQECQLIANN
jgi:uncharacterized coiled-coil protein SlyX